MHHMGKLFLTACREIVESLLLKFLAYFGKKKSNCQEGYLFQNIGRFPLPALLSALSITSVIAQTMASKGEDYFQYCL